MGDATVYDSQHGVHGDIIASHALSTTLREDDLGSDSPGFFVFLHIYDVSRNSSIHLLNSILAHKSSPVKFGGVFHAGVEVAGIEWGYGYQPRLSKSGVHSCLPRKHSQHSFRQTVVLPSTKLTEDQINDVISDLIEEYPGNDYHLLSRNCCHFADDFAQRLGVGGIPSWVHRLANVGAVLNSVMSVASVDGMVPTSVRA